MLKAVLALFCIALTAAPQNLADASLEQLMNIEVVSAGRKTQPLKTAAASVFVITAEDMRRSGMQSLPDVLRLAPGVQVARTSAGTWSISIRGFNGDYANKLLVLVDGRVVYNDIWAGVFWDMEDLPLDDLERIEVIRGPAAALWGANAVNGVINILTKSARVEHGGSAQYSAGVQGQNASLRYTDAATEKASYRISARHSTQQPLPADPGGFIGEAPFTSATGWESNRMAVRVDWALTPRDSLFFSGHVHHSTLGQSFASPTPSNLFAPRIDNAESSIAGGFTGEWQHSFDNGSNLEARLSWDHQDHGYATVPITYDVLDSDLVYRFSAGSRNDLVAGVNMRAGAYRTTPTPGHRLDLIDRNPEFITAFLEDQISLVPGRLYLIVGANAGHNPFTGPAIQPTGRLLWTPTPRITYWAAVSRALRTPSLSEFGINYDIRTVPVQPSVFGLVHAFGDPDARAESVLAYEAGQRIEVGKRFSLDISGFWNRYQRLLYFESLAPVFRPPQGGNPPYVQLPIQYENAFAGDSHGLELSVAWKPSTAWKLSGGYSWLNVSIYPLAGHHGPMEAVNQSPSHQFSVRSSWDVTRRIEADAGLYYTGQISAEAAGGVPTPLYLRGDLRLGWRAGEHYSFSAGVQDAFRSSHLELPAQYQTQMLLVQRNIYGSVTWKF
jgi:iron complex outermembrane receptor protein